MKSPLKDVFYIIVIASIFSALSASFSLVGTLLPDKVTLENPLHGQSYKFEIQEFGGHFIWGIAVGLVTLRVRYILLAGFLAVLIDSDHLVYLMQIQGIPRMGHSVVFAIISSIILLMISKRDYKLAVLGAASVLAHISYDVFDSEKGFPIFTPLLNSMIQFPKSYWIFFEIAAVAIVAIISLISSRSDNKVMTTNRVL